MQQLYNAITSSLRDCSFLPMARPTLLFLFITGDAQLLGNPPFMVALSLRLIPGSPDLISETATIPEFFPACLDLPNLSVGTQPFTKELPPPIAFQAFMWNFVSLESKN